MTTWSLLLHHSPLNTAGGTSGLIGPLKLATGAKMTFNLDDHDVLNFSIPAEHYQTDYVRIGTTDVIAMRNQEIVQRFRVVNRKFEFNETGQGTVSVTAWSYRAVVDNWVFHDTDKLDFETATPTDPLAEQSKIAWDILNEGQLKPHGNINLSRGVTPSTPVYRQLYIEDVSTGAPQHFFSVAQPRGSEIQSKIADLDDGFEWDISPDPANPRTHLKFNAWNRGSRNYHGGAVSPLLLSPATMSSWSVEESMGPNVIRAVGTTSTDVVGGEGPVAWRPATQDPAGSPPQGRWEQDEPTDIPTQSELDAWADRSIEKYTSYTAQWAVTLHPGRWNGPSHLWIGDSARIIVNVPSRDDEGNTSPDRPDILDLSTTLRVIGVEVSLESTGTESVSLTVNQAQLSFLAYIKRLSERLASIERR